MPIRGKTRNGRPKRSPPGGKPPRHSRGGRRGIIEEEKLLDAVAFCIEHRMSREATARYLADGFGRPPGTPLPLATLDANIAKVNARWLAEAVLDQKATKALQLRRLYRTLRTLKAAKNYREASVTERLIARIEGNEEAKHVKLTGGDGGPIDVRQVLTSDEQRKRIAELQETARARVAAATAAIAATVAEAEGGSPATDQPPPDADSDPK